METGIRRRDSGEMELTPFANQVGGQMPMFLLQPGVVAKVLNQREYNVYLNLPPQLKPFTPTLKGTLDVRVEEDSDGFVSLVGTPEMCSCEESSVDPAHSSSSAKRLRLRRSGSVVSQRTSGSASQTCVRSTSRKGKMRIAELLSGSVNTLRFMLLENLLAGHDRSCILDLKVGTRQYPDGASESKKEKHIQRVMASTSSVLGIRCCGMRVYRADLSGYVQQDKYMGRTQSEQELIQTLRMFLYGPRGLRRQTLLEFLKQARGLRTALQSCDSYRFYCASLLLVFNAVDESPNTTNRSVKDGDPYVMNDMKPGCSTNHPQDSLARLKLIDFANSTYRGMEGSVRSHAGPDQGCIKGVISLERILQQLLDEEEQPPSVESLIEIVNQTNVL